MYSEEIKVASSFHENQTPETILTYRQDGNSISLINSTSYYVNNKKSYEAKYLEELPTSKTWWFSNGKRKKKITFKNGKINGKWTTWNIKGEKLIEKTYYNGELIRTVESKAKSDY
tara:strand:- start:137 stop:484 length:348 start_codon:yes stop_codon:yes gene_type:complete